MFRNVWMAGVRPADEFRTLVAVASLVITLLVLFTALIITSFGIPNDIKNLNIYTVVTKPVERFEIVLGRFLGYVALMTMALVGMTGVSLVLIEHVHLGPESPGGDRQGPGAGSRQASSSPSRKAEFEGTNVGREFDYRKYIAGHPDSPQRAIWHFTTIPSVDETRRGRPRAGRVHLRHLQADEGRTRTRAWM